MAPRIVTSYIRPTGTAPGVLVWPDIFGLRPAFRQMGQAARRVRLFRAGGESVLSREEKLRRRSKGAASNIQTLVPMMNALNETTHMTDAKAFVAWLDQQSSVAKNKKLGTQGYCMGGPMAFRTAAAVPDRVGAVASFHGASLVTKDANSPHLQVSKTKAHLLVAIAANDDQRSPTDKDVMKETFAKANVTAEIEVYKGAHGWCPPDSSNYNEADAGEGMEPVAGTFTKKGIA
ncbi:MAG: dienelactone hydrolase family protein [Acidobacteriota bacterium]